MNELLATTRTNRIVLVATLGLWSATLSIGALRVILPVYFAAQGIALTKIALLFVFFKLSQIVAPIGMGLTLNRIGYRKGFVGTLILHGLLSFLYLFKPGLPVIYQERLTRGLVTMPLMGEVYIKHYSPENKQGHHINLMLGRRDVAKGGGMLLGGILIAYLPLHASMAVIGLIAAIAAGLAARHLPDVREQKRQEFTAFWGGVNRKIKTLAAARGFLHGSEEAWTIVILPVYLTSVLGLSPSLVGTVLMSLLFFQGGLIAWLSRLTPVASDPRRTLVVCTLALIPICIGLAAPIDLYAFLALAFVFYFFNSASTLSHNHLKLKFAEAGKGSVDLATYKFISHLPIPVVIWLSGLVAEHWGFGWALYRSAVLAVLSALSVLALPAVSAVPAQRQDHYWEMKETAE